MKIYDYTRKSEEDKKRQVQSFENQIDAINAIVPPYGVTFEPVYEQGKIPQESKTGKIPGIRPYFNIMMDSIEADLARGQKVGIRVWQVSRLARNEADGGRVRQAVIGGLTIFDPHKVWNVNDLLYLSLEMAENSNYSLKVSFGAKSGLATKLKHGKVPGYARLGYLNTPEREQGTREILVDPIRFPLVQKMWRMLLSFKYNVNQIHQIAINDWKLTSRHGKPLARSALYEIFADIFYTGKYYYYGGQLYDNGIHKPMITLDEFELAQKILGSRGKPFQTTREFAYTNWLMCICGSTVSANERFRRHCYTCKDKFNAEKHDKCPKCGSEGSLNLIYTCTYQCNRKRDPKCKQPSISLKNLEMQMDTILETLVMPDAYVQWGLDMLEKDNEQEIMDRQSIETSLQAKLTGVKTRLDNMSIKYNSAANINGEIYTDEEYIENKKKYKAERLQIETELANMTKRQDTWMDNAEKAFNLAKHSRYWFANGTKQQKRAIFQAISSNPSLDNGKLRFQLLKPFEAIQKLAKVGIEDLRGFEPQENVDNTIKSTIWDIKSPLLCG